MKQFRNLLLFIPLAFGIVSCDTDDLKNDIDDLKDRVTNLEAQVQIFNENLNALRVLTQDDAKTIKNWSLDQGKYTIELSDGQTIVLTQGVEGSATTPDIEIGTDGYWYIDGEKQPVKAQGSDAPTPEFRITGEGYWQVDLDGISGSQYDFEDVTDETGAPVKATTSGSINMEDQFFKSVREENGFLVVEVKGYDEPIKLPIDADLVCEIVRTSITGLKDGVLTVGYGMEVEFTVKVNGERYAVTAPAGWTAVLGEPAPETNEATLKLIAPAQLSTLSRATADNTTDLTLQVNNGVNWAVDKIKVVAENVVASYYELFNSGQTIEIAGVELKKSDWDKVTGFSIKQIKSSGNGSDDNKITQNGIYFLEAGAEAVYTYTGAVTNLFIIRDNSIDNTAKLVMTGNNYVKLNNNAEPINSKFVCEGLNLDATAMTNYQVTANGKFGQIVFSNCNINLTTEKAFIYVANTVTDREFDKIIIKNCKFDWTNRTQDKGFQLCNLQTTSIKSSISLVNNVFYAKGKDAKLQIFNFLKKDIPYVEMKNNTFVNAVPLTDGYIKCKSVTSIDIQNNLFYSTNYSSNQLLFRYDNDNADGATISTTGTVSNNFGNKGDKIWKLFYSNNVIEGGTQIDNTKETIFSNMDYDKVIFTPIDELSSCGATID